jgi:lipopolysaccharide/colanic/teichoic acid biosynthesis glycosyltransferase/transposase-like protein
MFFLLGLKIGEFYSPLNEIAMIINLQNQGFIEKVKNQIKSKNILKQEKIFSPEERMKIVVEGQSAKMTIDQICAREGITPAIFYQWTQNFLHNNFEYKVDSPQLKEFDEEDKFRIVIEGKTGMTSIAQLCRRENITQDTFLDWSQEFLDLRRRKLRHIKENAPVYQKNKQLIINESNSDTFNYFENYVDLSSDRLLIVLKSNSLRLNKINDVENVVSLQKINNVRYINKYFEKINSKLHNDGVFIGCLETFSSRRKRMKINNIPILNNLYFSFEFLFKRILPKISFAKKYYFDYTKGRDRLLSKAEALGRLVSCGFSIMDYKTIDGLLYFVVKKIKEPTFDKNPSYGPVYKMPRLGKNGKIIGVYKFRTMHPYSEYLQDYILSANGYAKTGKPADDFRIPQWGKFMRRFWLDELPQLYNVLKGELKLVGIRPVSMRYFQDIPKEMQKLRLTQLPGCVPPYVALNRDGNVMSVLQAEKEYLEEKIRNPYTTDTKYLLNAIFNIIFKHKRSA